jgi:hypothetical protein
MKNELAGKKNTDRLLGGDEGVCLRRQTASVTMTSWTGGAGIVRTGMATAKSSNILHSQPMLSFAP